MPEMGVHLAIAPHHHRTRAYVAFCLGSCLRQSREAFWGWEYGRMRLAASLVHILVRYFRLVVCCTHVHDSENGSECECGVCLCGNQSNNPMSGHSAADRRGEASSRAVWPCFEGVKTASPSPWFDWVRQHVFDHKSHSTDTYMQWTGKQFPNSAREFNKFGMHLENKSFRQCCRHSLRNLQHYA